MNLGDVTVVRYTCVHITFKTKVYILHKGPPTQMKQITAGHTGEKCGKAWALKFLVQLFNQHL